MHETAIINMQENRNFIKWGKNNILQDNILVPLFSIPQGSQYVTSTFE